MVRGVLSILYHTWGDLSTAIEALRWAGRSGYGSEKGNAAQMVGSEPVVGISYRCEGWYVDNRAIWRHDGYADDVAWMEERVWPPWLTTFSHYVSAHSLADQPRARLVYQQPPSR
jgi:hypothetical protein